MVPAKRYSTVLVAMLLGHLSPDSLSSDHLSLLAFPRVSSPSRSILRRAHQQQPWSSTPHSCHMRGRPPRYRQRRCGGHPNLSGWCATRGWTSLRSPACLWLEQRLGRSNRSARITVASQINGLVANSLADLLYDAIRACIIKYRDENLSLFALYLELHCLLATYRSCQSRGLRCAGTPTRRHSHSPPVQRASCGSRRAVEKGTSLGSQKFASRLQGGGEEKGMEREGGNTKMDTCN